VLLLDGILRIEVLGEELAAEPGERLVGRLLRQASEELDCVGASGVESRPVREDLSKGLGCRPVDSQQAVGRVVGGGALSDRLDDLLRHAADVLDEDDAQVDRCGPELAEGEGLPRLVGTDEPTELVGVEVAVRMSHIRPHDPEDPGMALEEAGPEFGQLLEVAARQVSVDLPEVLLHRVEVVDEPLGGRGDGVTGIQFGQE